MIYYVQLQHMLERANAPTASLGTEGQVLRFEIERHIHSFRAEIERYKNGLPFHPSYDCELQENGSIKHVGDADIVNSTPCNAVLYVRTPFMPN